MNNKTFMYKGFEYYHAGRGKWVINLFEGETTFNCEQDLKNYIDTRFFNIDLINK